MNRIAALLSKELADLRRNPGVFVPAVLTAAFSIVLPFLVAIVIPLLAGERLADSSDFQIAVQWYREHPFAQRLSPEGAIQAWIFQQFLILLVLAPVAGSMSVAAYTVIGEKQARTLEPILGTPITTFELLAAKILGALLPALALTAASFACYLVAVALFAQPEVFRALLTPRSIAIVFLLGPLAALAALQLAVCVSSRVNDVRSAQQIGALIILPIAGLLVAELTGTLQLTTGLIALLAIGLVCLNLALTRTAIVLFDREAILTRWR